MNKTCSISVCIPCIESHIVFLSDCLISIAEQSHTPKEVIISISNIQNMKKVKKRVNSIIKKNSKLNIVVLYTNDKKHAGENRNIALSNAGGDIITFIDADDIMRKDRLNIIYNIFNLYDDCMGLYHYFYENKDRHMIDCECDECCENFCLSCVEEYIYSDKLHFGHGSFRRKLFDEFLYTDKPRGQDVEFAHNVLQKYLKNLKVYKKPLSFYNSKNSSFY